MRIVAIHTAPGRRLPVKATDSVQAEEGLGLVGDRYHGTKRMHVTIQSREMLDLAAADLGREIDSGDTRRNLTVDAGEVPTKPGTRMTIGEVHLEVLRVSPPCRLLDDGIGRGAAAALSRRTGSVCRLLSSGTISVGDEVRVEAAGQTGGYAGGG